MLVKLLEENSAKLFLGNYLKLTEYRSDIAHKRRRSIIWVNRTPVLSDPNSNAIFDWCRKFIPACWSVFAELRRGFIHKPM